MSRIYVASSWRNPYQQHAVRCLRELGHAVYDFRNPAPGNSGFKWEDVSDVARPWTAHTWSHALRHPAAQSGYHLDVGALASADATVLVLPAGRSASWELGYAVARGQQTAVFVEGAEEPDLMFMQSTLLDGFNQLQKWGMGLYGMPAR